MAEIEKYYSNLLIAQFKSKPRARATIELIANCFAVLDDSGVSILVKIREGFNIVDRIAEGNQLEVLGKYVGINRSGPGAISKQQINLEDPEYAQLIKLKTALNNLGSSLAEIDDFIDAFFPGQLRLTDLGSMKLQYLVTSAFGSRELLERVLYEKLLPKPMGVTLAAVLYVPVGGPYFGFSSYDRNKKLRNLGHNTYGNYSKNKPWLTYDYEIEIRSLTE